MKVWRVTYFMDPGWGPSMPKFDLYFARQPEPADLVKVLGPRIASMVGNAEAQRHVNHMRKGNYRIEEIEVLP